MLTRFDPWPVAAVAAGVLVSWLALALFRRQANRGSADRAQDSLANTYAPIYEAYAIVLGLIVVGAWQDFQDAEAAAAREAGSLVNLARLARAYPEEQADLVADAAEAYAVSVLDSEWKMLANGRPSIDTVRRLDDLYDAYASLNSTPTASVPQYAQAIDELDELDEARGLRLLYAQREIPRFLWVVLLLGGAITIGFAYLFRFEDAPLAYAVVGLIATIIALLLVLGYELSTPYSGMVQIDIDGFRRVFEVGAFGRDIPGI